MAHKMTITEKEIERFEKYRDMLLETWSKGFLSWKDVRTEIRKYLKKDFRTELTDKD